MMSLFDIILFTFLSVMVSSGFFSWYPPYGLFQISASLFVSQRYVLDLLNLSKGKAT